VQVLRIIDVNLNRLDESLKLIEDITRFQIEDRTLLAKIREIRKNFLKFKQSLPLEHIVAARKSHQDLGRRPRFDSARKKGMSSLLLSNLSRAKESSRIIEETLKGMRTDLSRTIKEIRFQIYDFEKAIVAFQTKRFDPYLNAIIDEQYVRLSNIERVAKTLVNNGATMIQLRAKTLSDRSFMKYASNVRKATKNTAVKFIINNRLDIALACDADGVHIGQKDIPVTKARVILGDACIIGASAHNLKEARKAEAQGADYLGVGAIYRTKTKSDAQICGLRTLRAVCKRATIPVIAIGGINDKNYKTVLKAGASGIAVASFLFEGNLKKRLHSLTAK
jgi:thiamine-phosphate pyrophosphorylase